MQQDAVILERAPCALCGADDHERLFEGRDRRHPLPGTFAIVRCSSCGNVYLNPRPSRRALALYYPEDYAPHRLGTDWLGLLVRMLRRREARALQRRLAPGARVVEVGCAAGDLMAPLRDLGFHVVGVEPSPRAAAAARAQGLTVHCGGLADSPLEENCFDAVVMRGVVEHLPDPLGDLRRANALLKPGGLIVLTTDNYDSLDRRIFGEDWYGFDMPRHLNVFTPQSLAGLLGRAGFGMPEVRFSLVPTHWIVSARYRLERRLGRSPVARLLSVKNPLLLGAFVPVAAVQRLLGNGGRMTLLAVKT